MQASKDLENDKRENAVITYHVISSILRNFKFGNKNFRDISKASSALIPKMFFSLFKGYELKKKLFFIMLMIVDCMMIYSYLTGGKSDGLKLLGAVLAFISLVFLAISLSRDFVLNIMGNMKKSLYERVGNSIYLANNKMFKDLGVDWSKPITSQKQELLDMNYFLDKTLEDIKVKTKASCGELMSFEALMNVNNLDSRREDVFFVLERKINFILNQLHSTNIYPELKEEFWGIPNECGYTASNSNVNADAEEERRNQKILHLIKSVE